MYLILPALIAGGMSLAGGWLANRGRKKEAATNRGFQERMRNTSWQAGVADMQAAGINPALAYSQGGASAPGGNMASQDDVISPAVSSAMQMKRLSADVDLIKQQTAKAKEEKRGAENAANMGQARLAAYGISRTPSGSLTMRTDPDNLPLMTREITSAVQNVEARTRREGYTADTLKPVAELAGNMGQWLPILGLISQMNPGGILRSAGRLKGLKSPRRAVSRITELVPKKKR